MIVQQSKTGQVRIAGIPNQTLAAMTLDQLTAELKRVDRDLSDVRALLREHPIHRREKNCLKSERRRIQAALEQKRTEGTPLPADAEVSR